MNGFYKIEVAHYSITPEQRLPLTCLTLKRLGERVLKKFAVIFELQYKIHGNQSNTKYIS